MPRSHIHGSSRRFYYGLKLTDDLGNANFRSPIRMHYIRMIKYHYVWLQMQYGKLRTNTDCHEWCRIVSVANPASSPWMFDLGISGMIWYLNVLDYVHVDKVINIMLGSSLMQPLRLWATNVHVIYFKGWSSLVICLGFTVRNHNWHIICVQIFHVKQSESWHTHIYAHVQVWIQMRMQNKVKASLPTGYVRMGVLLKAYAFKHQTHGRLPISLYLNYSLSFSCEYMCQ